MKKPLFLVFTILLFALQSFAQNDARKIAGAYQWCPFECETIKLNEDFTFDYLLDGDLFNNERTSGTWKFIEKDKIYLKSPERKLIYNVVEKQNGVRDKILVQVSDFQGAVIPGFTLRLFFQGQEKQYTTNEDGVCEIPLFDEIQLEWRIFQEKYKIANPQTRELIISVELTNEPAVDAYFLFKDGELLKLNDSGGVFENGYKKLKKKRTRKLFPKN